jgi:hypothetical protein
VHMSKNYLKNTHVYLVGNMERTADAFQWRDNITESLKELGVICFDPNKQHFVNQATENLEDRAMLHKKRLEGDYKFVSAFMKGVISRDLRYVDLAEFIVGNIEPTMPTWGTVHEIVIASLQNKPILLHIKDKTEFPLWLSGLLNMDLVFTQWDDLLKYLQGINSGEIYADPKYWKILMEEYK